MRNVLVFFGGRSCEHDISVITGVMTVNGMDKSQYNPMPVYVTGDGKWYTGDILKDVTFYKKINYKKLKRATFLFGDDCLYILKGKKICGKIPVYAVLNCMHGLNGEDGCLAGVIKMNFIPFCSPDCFISGAAIDKETMKTVLKGLNVKTLNCISVTRGEFYADCDKQIKRIEKTFGYPVMVKPARLGSSIGIFKACDRAHLAEGIKSAFLYDRKIVIEPALIGFKEVNAAAMKINGEIIVSETEEPVTRNDVLTFSDKYVGFKTGSKRISPARISDAERDKVLKITRKIYEKTDCRGIIRVDFFVLNGEVTVNELNTVPGSLAYYLFSDSIKKFGEILNGVIEQGVKDFKEYKLNDFAFKSDVLKIDGVKGGKTGGV